MFIRVFGNTYLNPDAVGKFEMDISFAEEKRTTVTRVYDLTGQHILLEAATTVTTGPELDESRLQAVRRDNVVHEQIQIALCERRDAKDVDEAIEERLLQLPPEQRTEEARRALTPPVV